MDAACDDSDVCTTDTCHTVVGCVNDGTGSTIACDDGVACTTDRCDPAAGCLNAPVNAVCDDANACTTDTCDTALGCLNDGTGVTDLCNDGDVCTTRDTCQGGDAGICQGSFNDTDGDGVCDAEDPCPLDNPNDMDGDGVCDSDDICPGCDDVEPCPIPTVSAWGLVAMALLVLTASTLLIRSGILVRR